ncbi:MAG: hypothetical protein AAF449_15560, partial [Myxococcota bacterium]
MAKLCIVELNEFCPDFLGAAADELGLENIKTVLSLKHSTTWTNDEVEHQGLDPWAQWASVHTGVPLETHGARRLGQTKSQPQAQIWSLFDRAGLSWGAWGVKRQKISFDAISNEMIATALKSPKVLLKLRTSTTTSSPGDLGSTPKVVKPSS